MRELFGNSKWIIDSMDGPNGVRLMKRIMTKLGKTFDLESFLGFLIHHPKLGRHELVTEFLMLSEIEQDMVQARTQSKLAYLEEQIRSTFDPFVTDLDSKCNTWDITDGQLIMLQNHHRLAGLAFRKWGRACKEIHHQLHAIMFQIGHPTSRLLPLGSHLLPCFKETNQLLLSLVILIDLESL